MRKLLVTEILMVVLSVMVVFFGSVVMGRDEANIAFALAWAALTIAFLAAVAITTYIVSSAISAAVVSFAFTISYAADVTLTTLLAYTVNALTLGVIAVVAGVAVSGGRRKERLISFFTLIFQSLAILAILYYGPGFLRAM